MLTLKRGNLLMADTDAIVNTVNTVGVMGKGIALQFQKAFPENFAVYERACKAQEVHVGKMLIVERHELDRQRPHYIVNFPTKKHWRQPSRIEYIKDGLDALVSDLQRLKIQSVAVPPLGCGLGGLQWGQVLPLIQNAAQRLPDVRWEVFEPVGAPDAASMPNNTRRPNLTKTGAAIVALMDKYLVPGFDYPVSLLEIQKLIYFLVAAGETKLRVKFRAATYGPYSDDLAHVLNRIDGHYVSGFGDGQNRPDTPMTLCEGAAKEATSALAADKDLLSHFNRVAELIEGYEDPFGMELLSTVHWVATREDRTALDNMDAAVRGVQKWSDRKASMFKVSHIVAAWLRLKSNGWLAADLAG